MNRILLLDNYDSFTYNLVHIIKALGYGDHLTIVRNDKITLEEVNVFDKILLSPGPGIPEEAGILKALIEKYGPSKSILGICLGLQAIAEVYGAQLYNMDEVKHGVSSTITINSNDVHIFKNIPNQFVGAHYHSWAVKKETLKAPLEVIGLDETGVVMAIKHEQYDVIGLQFHPESIMTEYGETMIKNWIETEVVSHKS